MSTPNRPLQDPSRLDEWRELVLVQLELLELSLVTERVLTSFQRGEEWRDSALSVSDRVFTVAHAVRAIALQEDVNLAEEPQPPPVHRETDGDPTF